MVSYDSNCFYMFYSSETNESFFSIEKNIQFVDTIDGHEYAIPLNLIYQLVEDSHLSTVNELNLTNVEDFN